MNDHYTPLEATRHATEYQRDWAKGLRAQITSGEQYAFVNADTPHELFHHIGLPIVTNQWWSAIIAAKQLSEFYFDYMETLGFHDRLARYSSLPLIAELEGDTGRQPWGGLPTPSILCARQSADDHQKIFSLWAEKTGAPLALLSSPAVPDPQPDWWRLARRLGTLYGTDRLDLMVPSRGLDRPAKPFRAAPSIAGASPATWKRSTQEHLRGGPISSQGPALPDPHFRADPQCHDPAMASRLGLGHRPRHPLPRRGRRARRGRVRCR